MASKKKKKVTKKQRQGLNNSQIIAIVLFFVNVLLVAFSAVKGENLWLALHNFMMGVGGFWIFAWLLFSGYILAMASFNKLQGKTWRLLGVGSVIVLIGTVIQTFFYNATFNSYLDFITYSYQNGIKGTGVLGALLSYPLASGFGKIGSIVILFVILIVVLLIMTGTTLRQFLTTVSKPVEKISENAKEAIQQRKLKKYEQEWDISIDGMPEEPTNPVAHDGGDIDSKGRRLVAKYHGEEELEEMLTPEEIEALNNEMGAANVPQDDSAVDLDEIIQKAQEDAEVMRPGKEQPTVTTQDDGTGQQEFAAIKVETAQPEEYRYPPVNLLEQNISIVSGNVTDELKNNAALLVDTLRSFGVETRILNISRGPSVTRYELQPAAGVKISKIKNLADDIALNLATAGVRIEAPIPNKPAVGFEVPNKDVASVRLRDIIDSSAFESATGKLTVAVGKDIAGNIVTADLSKMPHLLIAGTTGSGKSVCINSFILSILFKSSPEDVKLLMIDPKVVELEVYNGLPHLLVPVVTDPKKASGALGWAVSEMDRRYKVFGECKVRDLNSYNQFAATHEGFEKMPQVLIVVDELNDLMMVAPAEVEDSICRLAQKARAAGMHLVVATQRPSVDVITGLIKANIPSRISLKVANQIDSRTILDQQGAEKLLGKGDMLFYPVGIPKPVRVQGCWVSDDEIKSVVNYIIGDKENEYNQEIAEEIERHAAETKSKKNGGEEENEDGYDEMLPQAIAVVVEMGSASTSMLQRRLKLGYSRAARIVDQMEEKGIVGPFEGAKPRRVLITKQQYDEMRMNQSE